MTEADENLKLAIDALHSHNLVLALKYILVARKYLKGLV